MFTFNIITDGTKIKAGTKENAQKISMLIAKDHKIEMIDPSGYSWLFSGLNKWAEAADIMGPQ